MNKGTRVKLHPEEAPPLDGVEATVVAVKTGPTGVPYYLVRHPKGMFRALPHEVEELHNLTSLNGYSGDICVKCQSIMMIRIGTCLRCESCGETTGC